MIALTHFFKFFGLGLILVSLVFFLWHSLQAIGNQDYTDIFLGLGLALFGFVPGIVLFATAHSVHKDGPTKGNAITAIIFSVPLFALGLWLFYMPHIAFWPAFIVCVSAIIAAFWGALIWRPR